MRFRGRSGGERGGSGEIGRVAAALLLAAVVLAVHVVAADVHGVGPLGDAIRAASRSSSTTTGAAVRPGGERVQSPPLLLEAGPRAAHDERPHDGSSGFALTLGPKGGGLRARIEANIAASQEARAASRFPRTATMNSQLESITARASRITDRLVSNQSTYWARVYHNPALRGQKFAAAFAKNPAWGRSLIRGNIMDDVVKQLVAKEGLPFLRITRRGVRGPDFTNVFLGKAWDVTTPGSWSSHLVRYASDPYELLPLFY